jgi:hypothetical protein
VTLHIGAFKTGTSFIQAVLMSGRGTLSELGVLWPGDHWTSVVQAVQAIRGMNDQPYEKWTDIVNEIDEWPGESAIISMEFLSLLKPDDIARTVDSLSNHRVKVVLTVRDIGRTIPAQWQESVQNGSSWRYTDYLAGVTRRKPRVSRPGQHFWGRQDPVSLLEPWGKHIAPQDMTVVTVPPPGSAPSLLWDRFCEAAGIPPERFDSSIRVNESLGAHSAEVMRYCMMRADAADVEMVVRRTMKKTLAKQLLSSRKSEEPTLVLPPEHQDWAVQRGEQMVKDVANLGTTVVGDLQDLVPVFPPPKGPSTVDPSAASNEDLLAAAAFGLVGMSEELVSRSRRKGQGRRRQQ